MAGKFSRNKGARFERQLVQIFIDEGWGKGTSRRGWCQRFQSGHPDVLINELPFLWVEAKGQEKFLSAKLRKALIQADLDCTEAGFPFEVPVVVSKESHCQVYATLKLTDLLRIIRGEFE
jgi:hypothetical protein